MSIFKSNYASIELTNGFNELADLIGRPAELAEAKIPVTITGYITHQQRDQEFGIKITNLKIGGLVP